MPTELSATEVDGLRRTFKRCSPETLESILSFRRTGNLEEIPVIVRGIVRRFLREETRAIFDQAGPETSLASLGVDSLTMLEIILDVQEALDISIEDSELKQMQTVGDVDQFLLQKITSLSRA
ncbi:MAG TPA: acyl carrier protein [Chthoniobacteraceae bacterium]|jgi:acyl carrier protein|nr:acyl carrier protein [Chthoniobacteraceae bacterium]